MDMGITLGEYLGDTYQAVSFMIADMAIGIEAARALTHKARASAEISAEMSAHGPISARASAHISAHILAHISAISPCIGGVRDRSGPSEHDVGVDGQGYGGRSRE